MQNDNTTYTADFRPPAAGNANATDAFYADSFAEVLMRSIGYYVTCEFLIGTAGLEQKSGFLYAAGVNFITLHNVENNEFTVCDLYSVKFVTIHADRSAENVPGFTGSTQRNTSTHSFQPPQQTRRSTMNR